MADERKTAMPRPTGPAADAARVAAVDRANAAGAAALQRQGLQGRPDDGPSRRAVSAVAAANAVPGRISERDEMPEGTETFEGFEHSARTGES